MENANNCTAAEPCAVSLAVAHMSASSSGNLPGTLACPALVYIIAASVDTVDVSDVQINNITGAGLGVEMTGGASVTMRNVTMAASLIAPGAWPSHRSAQLQCRSQAAVVRCCLQVRTVTTQAACF